MPESKKKKLKKRADILLFEQGLAKSRSHAGALIMSGNVVAADKRVDKAGQLLPADAVLRVKGKGHEWVSRGGMKLDHAIKIIKPDLDNTTCIDVGSSTGGFTDVLLKNGAKKVFAVDVGTGQLDWQLRNDERVVVMEKTNARYLTKEMIPDPIDLVVCDASFISLKTVLPAALSLTKETALLIALIKPQFEAGRENIGKNGVVTDPEVHQNVCDNIKTWLDDTIDDWNTVDILQSPVTGPKGNVEFLLIAKKNAA